MRYALNTVAINGYQILNGYGTADVVIGASGYNNRQKTGVSTAALSEVNAVGEIEQAGAGGGNAVLSINAVGALSQGTAAFSSAAILDLDVHHGIPNPTVFPSVATSVHPSRVVKVQKEARTIDVYAESKFP